MSELGGITAFRPQTCCVGDRFCRLTIISVCPSKTHFGKRFVLLCDCGKKTVVQKSRLLSGNTKSCGCLRKERAVLCNTRHGHSPRSGASKTYGVWQGMNKRCFNEKDKNFKHYGGRGISVCKRWRGDNPDGFKNFLIDMGEVPSNKSLDRVNNDGNYCKKNCKWSLVREQANNRRNNHRIKFRGQTKTIAEWGDDLGINVGTLSSRLGRLGWNTERALTK